jgi:tetratricopeptide (TPR) repeat protein
MDAVSYPNPDVIDFFSKHLIPVRINIDSKPLPQSFKVQWTPTLVLLDESGEEHHRTVGFLAPGELVPSLMLGIGKSYFDLELFTQAELILEQVLQEYPQSDAAPEATYYLGVDRYKNTHIPGELKKTIESLQKNYPGNEWTKRASVYQLL